MIHICYQGYRGRPGSPGEKGKDGYYGRPGADGEPGDAGGPGRRGRTGRTGPDGEPGGPGRWGRDGEPGRTGPKVRIIDMTSDLALTEQAMAMANPFYTAAYFVKHIMVVPDLINSIFSGSEGPGRSSWTPRPYWPRWS